MVAEQRKNNDPAFYTEDSAVIFRQPKFQGEAPKGYTGDAHIDGITQYDSAHGTLRNGQKHGVWHETDRTARYEVIYDAKGVETNRKQVATRDPQTMQFP